MNPVGIGGGATMGVTTGSDGRLGAYPGLFVAGAALLAAAIPCCGLTIVAAQEAIMPRITAAYA